jgi:YD repeat-containing protein
MVEVRRGQAPTRASQDPYFYDLALAACGTARPSTSVGVPASATYCDVTQGPGGTSSDFNTVDYYDASNRLVQEVQPLARQVTTDAYPSSCPTGGPSSAEYCVTSEDAASNTTTTSYDADGNMVGVSYSTGSPAPITYSYDLAGRKTSMRDGTGTTTYSYDGDSRPTSVTNGSGATTSYGYDADGNTTCVSYPVSGAATCTDSSTSGTGLASTSTTPPT